jgi:hypothetical protein
MNGNLMEPGQFDGDSTIFATRQTVFEMSNSLSFYQVKHRKIWGDYSRILIAGSALRRGNDSNTRLYDRTAPLLLERTGPFVPSITLPGTNNIVVTDACRRLMLEDCPGLIFKPVIKQLIVMSDWEDWDWDASEPEEYPPFGEPENYIIGQAHSEDAAHEMGELWELPVAYGAQVDNIPRAPGINDRRIQLDTWNGQHIFLVDHRGSTNGNWLIVSNDGRTFLETYDREGLLAFQPCLT